MAAPPSRLAARPAAAGAARLPPARAGAAGAAGGGASAGRPSASAGPSQRAAAIAGAVDKLMAALDVQTDASEYVTLLTRNTSSYPSTAALQVAVKQKLMRSASNQSRFSALYEQIKAEKYDALARSRGGQADPCACCTVCSRRIAFCICCLKSCKTRRWRFFSPESKRRAGTCTGGVSLTCSHTGLFFTATRARHLPSRHPCPRYASLACGLSGGIFGSRADGAPALRRVEADRGGRGGGCSCRCPARGRRSQDLCAGSAARHVDGCSTRSR